MTEHWGPVHITPEEFENDRDFTLKMHQMFSVHTTKKECWKRNNQRPFWIWISGKSRDYRNVIVFEKNSFQNVFLPHENEKPVLSNFSGLNSVFENLRFRDGLVLTIGLTVRIQKLRLQISLVWCGRCERRGLIVQCLKTGLAKEKNEKNPTFLFKAASCERTLQQFFSFK